LLTSPASKTACQPQRPSFVLALLARMLQYYYHEAGWAANIKSDICEADLF